MPKVGLPFQGKRTLIPTHPGATLRSAPVYYGLGLGPVAENVQTPVRGLTGAAPMAP